MAGVERRAALGEIRVEGRKLTGTVMRYGEVSPSHKERFAPGAIRMADVVHLDLNHDRERVIAYMPNGGLELAGGDDALELVAELPPIPAADRALEEIRTGKTTGLSVEFRAVNGVPRRRRARDRGCGIVGRRAGGRSAVWRRPR